MLRQFSSRTQPLVLVVDKDAAAGCRALARYFSECSFDIYEAADEFDVIDELCDFTVRNVPDVITVPLQGANFERIADLINQSISSSPDLPVFLYSDSTNDPSTFSSVNEIEEWLNSHDKAAAASH